jgi:8-oxo-dGTP pyrophosphatase MutT (NUDIX family)
MKPKQIRAIAICIIRHNGNIFVFEGHDNIKDQTFYRPLGGAIEFGESSSQTVLREFLEEIGAEIINLHYLRTLENIFTYNGQVGHEIVIVYEGDFSDKRFYRETSVIGQEDTGLEFKAMWKPLLDFENDKAPLYPDGLLEILQKG